MKSRQFSSVDRTRAAEAVAVEALGFLAGVLDHIGSDESLLVMFAANAGMNPEDVASACALLGGRDGIESFT